MGAQIISVLDEFANDLLGLPEKLQHFSNQELFTFIQAQLEANAGINEKAATLEDKRITKDDDDLRRVFTEFEFMRKAADAHLFGEYMEHLFKARMILELNGRLRASFSIFTGHREDVVLGQLLRQLLKNLSGKALDMAQSLYDANKFAKIDFNVNCKLEN